MIGCGGGASGRGTSGRSAVPCLCLSHCRNETRSLDRTEVMTINITFDGCIVLGRSAFHTFLSRHPVLLVVFLEGKYVEVGVDKQSTVACYEAGHVFGCDRLQQQCDRLHVEIIKETTEVDNISFKVVHLSTIST